MKLREGERLRNSMVERTEKRERKRERERGE